MPTIHRLSYWLIVSLALASCRGPVAIRAICEVESAPIRVAELRGPNHQIAVDGDALLWVQYSSGSTQWTGQWFDLTTETELGTEIDLGLGDVHRPDWNRRDGRLIGMLLSDINGIAPPHSDSSGFVGKWELDSSLPSADRTSVSLDIPDGCLSCLSQTNGGNNAAYQGTFPIVEMGGQKLTVLSAVASECVTDTAYSNYSRLRLVDLDTLEERVIFWGDDRCRLHPPDLATGPAWPVALSDGNIGILVALGVGVPSPLSYVVVSPDGEVLRGPVRVGTEMRRFDSAGLGSHQSRAVRMSSRILFTEPLEYAYKCSGLRIMNEDGSSAGDAPWQLPCRADPTRHVNWVELRPMGDRAVVAWSENSDPLDGSLVWSDDVWLALLDGEGRLASEPLAVTAAEASAVASWVVDPETGRLIDGVLGRTMPMSIWVDDADTVFVSYGSVARGHDGLLVRRVDCRELE
jgi:hypothetical protein